MTATLKTLIEEIQELSLPDQLELVHVITLNLSRNYRQMVPQTDFWQPKTLEEIIQAQHTPTIENIDDLAVDFWPDDESVDDFIEYTYGQRRADREKDYEDPFA